VWRPRPNLDADSEEDGFYYGTTAAVNNLYAWYEYTDANRDLVEWGYDCPAHRLLEYLRSCRAKDEHVMKKVRRYWYPFNLNPMPPLNPIQGKNKLSRDERDAN